MTQNLTQTEPVCYDLQPAEEKPIRYLQARVPDSLHMEFEKVSRQRRVSKQQMVVLGVKLLMEKWAQEDPELVYAQAKY